MLAKRIIGALDIANGRVVKGVNFENMRDSGDPVDLAKRYELEGIDELVFLDIRATNENRNILYELAEKVASEIYIPFTVGGGLKNIGDMIKIIRNGADKVFINTYAVENPGIIEEISDRIGTANTVIAIDSGYSNGNYYVYTNGGTVKKTMDTVSWAKKAESLGAGELLITSINKDGTKKGFDTELISRIANNVNISVIASGGAGSPHDFLDAFNAGADGALAASIFHEGKYTPNEVKEYLKENGINVRL
ncbi:imidazole glycerol phosphate synthase subunit HisF [Ferroplasma sp.]|uniref:imidazole glycerol phosphate synthase subunit HisF n=1 Tax=Ferroplasma sp. TaxID=2591003 RepID=UPI00307DF8EA